MCLSSIGCPSDTVNVFDSLRPSHVRLESDVEEVIVSILFTKSLFTIFVLPDVQRQSTGVNCGLFALAFAYEVRNNKDPKAITFHESKMRQRQYFLTCLEKGPFLSAQRKTQVRHRTLEGAINVFCSCRLPDSDDKMLQCDSCEEWYHFTCIEGADQLSQNTTWHCPVCSEKKTVSV